MSSNWCRLPCALQLYNIFNSLFSFVWHFLLFLLPLLFCFHGFPFLLPKFFLWLSNLLFPHVAQTCPITRLISIASRLSIKEVISPQWPMPWQGWAPRPLSPPCPAELAPSAAYMTGSCSAREARKPLSGWRWKRGWWDGWFDKLIRTSADRFNVDLFSN